MKTHERFLHYVTFGTASNPAAAEEGKQPSSPGQWELARYLEKELRELGVKDARLSEACYVYGSIPATPGYEDVPALGFVAHMDTAPDASGDGVKPVLHENYDGGDVILPSGRVISAEKFSDIRQYKGQTLITASGDTLLGADDKAGVAEIVTLAERLLCGGVPHGKVCIAFTPDEEVGCGTAGFDVEEMGAQFAYTVDGGVVNEVEYESFNAAAARVKFTGVEVHPGTACGIMVNAASLAAEFDALLPAGERPQNTSGRQGFYHLTDIAGAVGHAQSDYIIRDHDRATFEERKSKVQQAARQLEEKYGPGSVSVEISDTYYNMGEVIEKNFHLVECAKTALRALGLEPEIRPIRGGTDGSNLSFMGLPCPNLGTGGLYFHGPNECISVQAMEQATELLLGIVGLYASRRFPGNA